MTSCQQLLWGRLANTYQSFCQALCCQKVQRAWCLCCLAFQQVDTTVRWKNRQILKTAIKNYVCLNLLTSTFSSVYSFTLPLFILCSFFFILLRAVSYSLQTLRFAWSVYFKWSCFYQSSIDIKSLLFGMID